MLWGSRKSPAAIPLHTGWDGGAPLGQMSPPRRVPPTAAGSGLPAVARMAYSILG